MSDRYEICIIYGIHTFNAYLVQDLSATSSGNGYKV